jgi:ubiquinone/menaquinone biosynthesis C-methylase UbiE
MHLVARTLAVFLLVAFLAACDDPSQTPATAETDTTEWGGTGQFYMGREIAAVRGHEMAEFFDRPDREATDLPDRLVRGLELDSTDVVADIGAGTGYFTFRLSSHVPNGRVLAVDIDEQMLALIEERQRNESVGNVETVLSRVDDPALPDRSVDVALIVDSYHEFSHPAEMLDGIYSGLREGGRLIIVEYRGEDDTIDVHPLHRMTEAQLRTEVEASGFEWVETRDFLPQQHVVVFRRPVSD